MDDHIRNSDVHLMCCWYLHAIEVDNAFSKNFLHLVHLVIVSHLYQSIVDLPNIYLMTDLGCSLSVKASLVTFKVEELFTMRRRISHVKDVSKHGSSRQLHPIQFLACINQSIVNCLRLISSTRCLQFVYIVDCLICICEVLNHRDVGWLLRRVISVGHYRKPQSYPLSPNFGLNFLDDCHNCWLNLS